MIDLSTGAISKLSAIAIDHINAQSADDRVTVNGAGIAVESEREVDGDTKSLAFGPGFGTSQQVVDPWAAVLVVVAIVIIAMRRRINAVGNAGPLHVITGSF